MRELTLKLDDETLRELEKRTDPPGRPIEQFLEERLPRAVDDLVLRTRAAWPPRAAWDALIEGTRCPVCEELASEDGYGGGDYVVARSRASVLTLSPNQSQPGYCVLWSTKHVAEPFQLDPDRAADFLGDMMAAARAIHRVYGADKLNYQVLGNVVPHLHCHIIPRYVGDRAPGGPILPDARPMHLPPAEHRTQVERLRKALAYSQA